MISADIFLNRISTSVETGLSVDTLVFADLINAPWAFPPVAEATDAPAAVFAGMLMLKVSVLAVLVKTKSISNPVNPAV